MSSISRAFTTRRVKQSVDIAASKKDDERNRTMRTQISSPLELIHTTNMLSYNAPDIMRSNSVSTADGPGSPATTIASTPPTSPDVDSKDETRSPAPNHLSGYFMPPPQGAAGGPTTPEVTPAPAIPKRSPSHTKQSSLEAVAKQRSMSTMSKESDRTVSTKASATFSRASSTSTAPSTLSHNSLAPSPKPPMPSVVPSMPPPVTYQQPRPAATGAEPPHPFGRELAQVSEIAEEFGIKDSVMEEEQREMKRRGLRRVSPDDYLSEVQALFATFYGTTSHINRSGYPSPLREQPPPTMWI